MTCKQCGANNGDDLVCCDICGYILDTSENDGQDAAKLADQPQNSETPEADEENNPVDSEQHAAPPVSVYCMQCGSANTPDIRFCQFCGAPRQAVRRSEPAAAQPKKTRLALLCGIIVAAAVIIAALLLLAGSSSALPLRATTKPARSMPRILSPLIHIRYQTTQVLWKTVMCSVPTRSQAPTAGIFFIPKAIRYTAAI